MLDGSFQAAVGQKLVIFNLLQLIFIVIKISVAELISLGMMGMHVCS